MRKRRIYIDMDGVIVDYYNTAREYIRKNPNQKFPQSTFGFFLKLPFLNDAKESFMKLYNDPRFDVWILTRPSPMNVHCYSEKAQWVWDNLGFDVMEKTILSCDKSLLMGDYLIDDQNNAKQDQFHGEWIQFGNEKFPDWKTVISYIDEKEKMIERAHNAPIIL